MTVISPAEPAATYRQVFADPTFRVLFGTRSLAIAAETLRMVALAVLVYAATDSALLGAVTYGIGFLPQVVGGVLFGAIADRVRPRRMIVAGYVLQGATTAALALPVLPLWAGLGIVVGVSCAAPLFAGATSRLVAESLTGDAYVLGRSLMSMASSGAQLIGLAGGGVAIAALGAREALLVSAACQIVSAIVTRLALGSFPAPGVPTGRSALRQSWVGTGHLLADRAVRGLFLAQWLPPAYVVGAESLLVPYAAIRGLPAGAPGLLLACIPVGMLVGDLVIGRLVRPARRERLFMPLVALLGGPLVGLAADPPLPVVALLLATSGCGFAYALTLQRRFLEAVPSQQRGHAFALLGTGLMTAQGAGPVLFGGLSEVVGVGVAIAAAGTATVVTGAALRRAIRPRRSRP